MTLGELIEHVRHHVLRDEAKPPLWPDELLARYFTEAQEQFATRTHCLNDESSGFTKLTTAEGQADYALDPRILFVAELYDTLRGVPLRDLNRTRAGFRGGIGRPAAYRLDVGRNSLKLFPTPDGEYELSMLVARLPLSPLVNDGDTPEIPAQYHTSLCEWVAYRCLRANDVEMVDDMVARPQPFRAEWDLAVRDAKRDVYRLQSGPNPRATGNWTGKR